MANLAGRLQALERRQTRAAGPVLNLILTFRSEAEKVAAEQVHRPGGTAVNLHFRYREAVPCQA